MRFSKTDVGTRSETVLQVVMMMMVLMKISVSDPETNTWTKISSTAEGIGSRTNFTHKNKWNPKDVKFTLFQNSLEQT